MQQYTLNTSYDNLSFYFDSKSKNKKDKHPHKTIVVDITFNDTQKQIINNWFDAAIIVYNETIRRIKNRIKLNQLDKLKFYYYEIKKLNNFIKRSDTHLKKCISDNNKNIKLFDKKQKKKRKTELDLQLISGLQNIISNLKIKIHNLKIAINNSKNKCKKYEVLKNKLYNKIYDNINYYKIRKQLYKFKTSVHDKSGISTIEYNTKIQTHTLDYAIKRACTNYTENVEKYLYSKKKKFNMRFLKHKKTNKVVEIEKTYIINNKICPKIFGNINLKYNGQPYTVNKNHNVKIHYNAKTNKYRLLVPEKIEINPTKEKKYIGLDPGMRSFQTGLSNNEMIFFGSNMSDKIRKDLKRIDVINKKEKDNKKKKRKTERYYTKIDRMVDDMHWKIINYLTENYNEIIIGKISTSSIVSNKTSVLTNMQKRIIQMMKHFTFRQRLEYKCKTKGIKFKAVNEYNTTKTCSKCGTINNVGRAEIYNCKNVKCKLVIDRDINGCRGILLKTLKY
jgi:transposase